MQCLTSLAWQSDRALVIPATFLAGHNHTHTPTAAYTSTSPHHQIPSCSQILVSVSRWAGKFSSTYSHSCLDLPLLFQDVLVVPCYSKDHQHWHPALARPRAGSSFRLRDLTVRLESLLHWPELDCWVGMERHLSSYMLSTQSDRGSKVFNNSMNGMGGTQKEQLAGEASSHRSQAQMDTGSRVSPGKERGMFFLRNEPRKTGWAG